MKPWTAPRRKNRKTIKEQFLALAIGPFVDAAPIHEIRGKLLQKVCAFMEIIRKHYHIPNQRGPFDHSDGLRKWISFQSIFDQFWNPQKPEFVLYQRLKSMHTFFWPLQKSSFLSTKKWPPDWTPPTPRRGTEKKTKCGPSCFSKKQGPRGAILEVFFQLFEKKRSCTENPSFRVFSRPSKNAIFQKKNKKK